VIGPFGLGLIQDVAIVKHLAEMGVVFLLFNIGLELSLERLQTLARAVFGMGLIHFVASTLAIAGVAHLVAGYGGPCSVIVGGALALSSTAVAMQARPLLPSCAAARSARLCHFLLCRAAARAVWRTLLLRRRPATTLHCASCTLPCSAALPRAPRALCR
jgi:Sodium/hydrogen exchanger family